MQRIFVPVLVSLACFRVRSGRSLDARWVGISPGQSHGRVFGTHTVIQAMPLTRSSSRLSGAALVPDACAKLLVAICQLTLQVVARLETAT